MIDRGAGFSITWPGLGLVLALWFCLPSLESGR